MATTTRDAFDRLVDVSAETIQWARELVVAVRNSFGERRRARIEAELDRKQDELRRTVLQLADALGMEAHEARKALIRESFLASGRTPSEPSDS
ncbi:hypothetical protein [Agromyces atrinae]|uniref:Uncharacterized protein n=1 Tax=Agromyces atrinae TaxID=592376 RepID=A0A4Q2M9V0_9MICO|nr:hypothetical protein [Agromyces atrinae]NYD66389.1 hypothetical protein [Agromyces atrinae]RXZ86702.1 hypothetical protein ESP50_09990 [Agromyces atrinae]